MSTQQRFPIGQKYTITRKGYSREYEIVDVLKTYNSAGELVRLRYVAQFELMGQKVTDWDVVDTTIAIALSKQAASASA